MLMPGILSARGGRAAGHRPTTCDGPRLRSSIASIVPERSASTASGRPRAGSCRRRRRIVPLRLGRAGRVRVGGQRPSLRANPRSPRQSAVESDADGDDRRGPHRSAWPHGGLADLAHCDSGGERLPRKPRRPNWVNESPCAVIAPPSSRTRIRVRAGAPGRSRYLRGVTPDSSRNRADLRRDSALQRRFRVRLIEERGHRCEQCGNAEKVEAHHRVPLNQGGTWDLENGQLLCPECHKSTRSFAWKIQRGDGTPTRDVLFEAIAQLVEYGGLTESEATDARNRLRNY
ncbi:hypothetical protein C7Y72_01305 [Paraconexibacter algicola]|uniref:HNH nuclease domain-containing protein n=1 Tax=Paraconexibacter algicola TaxID=2133960 RepID=A0A2T4UGN0_9ACTN|nr:hypothetical protein C7Y72_01305 [Paraconexibacter algicola]